jgi:transcription antitermination factor NusB
MYLEEDDMTPIEGEYNEEAEVTCTALSRRDQRALTLNLLYAMDSFDYQVSLESIAENFGRGFNCTINQEERVFTHASAIVASREALDEVIKPLLSNWRFDRIGCCTRLILRMAIWELMYTDVPASVAMNEAIELAKCFSELDAHKFINGILDEWVKRNRPEERIEPVE